jgi:O-antigen/teichoic acid export membrane protein
MTRIGFVTAPNTAQMLAEGRQDQVMKLGRYLNRYCFSLFMPLALFLFLFGHQLLTVWVGAEMASHSAPLLIASVCSYGFVMAGQYNSASILFGLARHQGYARNVMIEAVALFVGLILVIPRFGILGAAWLVASLMIVIRGFGTPWMLCRYLDFSFPRYMQSIYFRPLLAATPALAVGLLLKAAGLQGRNWRELFLGGISIAVTFLIASWWICIEPEHRLLLRSWISRRLKARFA